MANRLFKIAAALSTIAFGLTAIAFFVAGNVDSSKHFLTLFSNCHVSIDTRGDDACLEIFNDSSYGPYRGSIIGVFSSRGAIPADPKVSGFGNVAGVYYRMFRWRDGRSLWTFALSVVYLLIVFALLPVAWLFRRSRQSRRGFPVELKPVDE